MVHACSENVSKGHACVGHHYNLALRRLGAKGDPVLPDARSQSLRGIPNRYLRITEQMGYPRHPLLLGMHNAAGMLLHLKPRMRQQ